MDQLTAIVQAINSYLWGVTGLIPLLVGVGIFYTFKLKFVQIRKFGQAMRFTFRGLSLHGERAGKEGMTSFQSLATAVAAQVGTGNIAGAATAIAMGGPGAIFWMWIAAFFGMATIFFSISIIIALGFIGNMVQSNSIAVAFQNAFGIPSLYTGLFVAGFAAFIFFGGLGRIASTTEKIVPVMAFLYILGSLIVILSNYEQIIPAFKMIFVGAFNPQAATGGVIGATIKEAMRYGVARGLFSNEAGLGSTPHAHAVAKVQFPAQQGLVAIVGLFIDTFVVLNMTAFVIFTTGVLDGRTTGIELAQKAFVSGFGSFGLAFVAICLFFFAFSTIVGWYFFAEQNVKYLFGTKVITYFRIGVMCFLCLGSMLHVTLVWELADMFNGLMVIPNVIALFGLSKLVAKALNDYDPDYTPHK